jgi:hypothetical protein
MRFQCLVCLLLAGLAYGQAAPPATPPAAAPKAEQSASAAPDKAPEVKVGPDDTVITLKGFCADAAQQGDACKTAITRAQFERAADAMQPGMSPAIRRRAATVYAQLLKMSTAAEKRGLDKQPTFNEKMILARMQILSQELSHALQEDSGKVSDSEIEEYYKENEPSYEQASLARIFVPRVKQIVPAVVKPKPGAPGAKPKATPPQPPTEAQQKATEAGMTEVAADLRARAVAGEDPDKLQKAAYAAAGLPGNAPSTKMEKVRRSTLPTNHQAVMNLKPGEVSEVISDPNSGHYIYKLVSKQTLALDDDKVKTEIRSAISSQRYRDSMKGFQNNESVDLNDAYFGPTRNPAMPQPPRGAKPPAQAGEDDPD